MSQPLLSSLDAVSSKTRRYLLELAKLCADGYTGRVEINLRDGGVSKFECTYDPLSGKGRRGGLDKAARPS